MMRIVVAYVLVLMAGCTPPNPWHHKMEEKNHARDQGLKEMSWDEFVSSAKTLRSRPIAKMFDGDIDVKDEEMICAMIEMMDENLRDGWECKP